MKVKINIFLICFTLTLLSCNQKNSSPKLEEHFTKSQIEDLNTIRLFFINSILEIKTSEFETDYLKIVSNYSSNCSFSSYDNSSIDNFSLTGSNKIFQYYEASLKQKGVIDCDSPVMVIAHDNATKDEINIIIPWPK